jgi:hypothetical protein
MTIAQIRPQNTRDPAHICNTLLLLHSLVEHHGHVRGGIQDCLHDRSDHALLTVCSSTWRGLDWNEYQFHVRGKFQNCFQPMIHSIQQKCDTLLLSESNPDQSLCHIPDNAKNCKGQQDWTEMLTFKNTELLD